MIFGSVFAALALLSGSGDASEAAPRAQSVATDSVGYKHRTFTKSRVSGSAVPSVRPAAEERTYTSSTVNELIEKLSPLFKDPDLAVLFGNCFPNTLDTTVLHASNGQNGTDLDAFVITGDIAALWLRDSANQVMPYVPYVAEDAALAQLVEGLIARHAHSILLNPFANAYNFDASGDGHQTDQTTPPMTRSIFEMKYEIDSLGAFMKLSYWYWKYSGSTAFMTTKWIEALNLARSTIETMQEDTGLADHPPYSFSRVTSAALDTLELYGRGPPVLPNGLSRSLFRPSDDAVKLGYNIPGNAMACVELTHMSELLGSSQEGGSAAVKTAAAGVVRVGSKLCSALNKVVFEATHVDKVLPYEIDGYGASYRMDDANTPSLLSLPFLGYMKNDHAVYSSTRDFVLSKRNPYFFKGAAGEGIGGPHVGVNYAWPMAITMRAMTSASDDEIVECIKTLKSTALSTGLMHEAFHVDNVDNFTREWFAWANGLFGELLLQLIYDKPHLVLVETQEALDAAKSIVKIPVSLRAQQSTVV